MKSIVIGFVLAALVVYAAPLRACDCDTAMAILHGVPDRLHRPWPGDTEGPDRKAKNPENLPKQEVQPQQQQEFQQKGDVKR
jgi:hypothetical protein